MVAWWHGGRLMMDGLWRSTIMGGVRAPLIVKIHPIADPDFGLTTADPDVQVDALIFQGSP